MKIIMLNANLMVEIVAIIAWKTGTFIAVIVPVSLVMPPLVRLEYHTGLEMISAMMKTTMLCVDLMVVIAVHLTPDQPDGTGIAMIVNA